eukprot:1130453-Pleurochrysis_carterae.AAC.1
MSNVGDAIGHHPSLDFSSICRLPKIFNSGATRNPTEEQITQQIRAGSAQFVAGADSACSVRTKMGFRPLATSSARSSCT